MNKTATKTASLVGELVEKDLGSRKQKAGIYKLSEPVNYHNHSGTRDNSTEYVWLSGVWELFPAYNLLREPFVHEVMAFPSDEDGNVLDWCELAVERGTIEHAAVLADLGFTIKE